MSFLVAESISRRYGDTEAVRDFTLSVKSGETFALVGPDGAGKTTLLRIVCGLVAADSGVVRIEGQDIHTRLDHLKQLMGYMPQRFSLYPDLSVEENLTFYAGLYGIVGATYRTKRDRLYEFSRLGPFASRRASALSGGMKQKLALSCALIHDPELLILDEPTTGVDPLSRAQFWDILLQLKQDGVTIVVSTPYMDEVARCGRAAFMLDGRKLAEGAPSELAQGFTGRIFAAQVEPTAHLLTTLNNLPGLAANRFGAGVHLYVPADIPLERFTDDLRRLGIKSDNVTPVTPGLEDRFIQLMEQPA